MDVEAEIEKIKERNKRVEADKAWELSNARKLVIGVATYVVSAIILVSINAPNPFLNALIPAFAFILSTATFPVIKDVWIKNFYPKMK
jgi:hypothetical protein